MSETDDRSDAYDVSKNFWDDLLDCIDECKVIPVLGRELITVTIDGQEVPLYRAIAEGLLKRAIAEGLLKNNDLAPGGDVVLRPQQELNDAVAELKKRGKSVQDLYSLINRLLKDIMSQTQATSEALRDLAGITNFDLFITTTFDDLLVNAIDQVRSDGAKSTDKIIYAPNLSEDARHDIPEMRPSNYHAVFYLFGQASTSPVYAIHDEDTLEFLYSILTEHGTIPERMISEVRNRNLLLIGCNFADWLSRFFIRLSNQTRLSSSERPKREFLVGTEISQDQSLTVFLERFSLNSRLYPCDARSFIKELGRRWKERHPSNGEPNLPDQAPSTGEIFISYSHDDLAAAKRLYQDLVELGGNIIWFDKGQLSPGVEWNDEIMAAIKRCKIFLPILSLHTARSVDRYFLDEWETAKNRKGWSPGGSFKIIPVIIEKVSERNTDPTDLIPENLRDIQCGFAPDGQMDDQLRERIGKDLRDLRRGRSS